MIIFMVMFEPWFRKSITTLHLYQLFSIYRNQFEPLLYSIIIVNQVLMIILLFENWIWNFCCGTLNCQEKLLNGVNSILMLLFLVLPGDHQQGRFWLCKFISMWVSMTCIISLSENAIWFKCFFMLLFSNQFPVWFDFILCVQYL